MKRARIALVLTALLAAACTASPPTKTASTTTSVTKDATLHLAYLADMSVPDPDVFYDIEGNAVILSVYEGLVKYAPDSTKIVPSLAKSYTVSPDGLTYTFTLRSGVKV